MANLVECYAAEGLVSVKSYLQTGNIVFITKEDDIEALKSRLEVVISKRFGFTAKVFIVDEHQLESIVEQYPFDITDGSYQHYVIFTNNNIVKSLYEQGVNLKSQVDSLALGDNVVYWKVQKGMTVKSPFSKLLVKTKYKDFHTNRNMKTIIKLLDL